MYFFLPHEKDVLKNLLGDFVSDPIFLKSNNTLPIFFLDDWSNPIFFIDNIGYRPEAKAMSLHNVMIRVKTTLEFPYIQAK